MFSSIYCAVRRIGLHHGLGLCVALGLLGLAAGFAQTDRVPQLLEDLHSKDGLVRVKALIALGQVKDPRAVEPLIVILQGKNVGARGLAAMALGNIGDARAVEPLIGALQTERDPNTKLLMVLALATLKDPRSIEVLTAALDDKAPKVRTMAATALGNIKDPRAAQALKGALNSEDPQVRAEAARVIARNNAPPGSREADPTRAEWEQTAKEAEQFPVPALPAMFDVAYLAYDPAVKAALKVSAPESKVDVKLYVESNQVRLVRNKKGEFILPASAIQGIAFMPTKESSVLAAAVVGGVTMGLAGTKPAVAAAEHFAATRYLVDILIPSEQPLPEGQKLRLVTLECDKSYYKSIVAALQSISGRKAGPDFSREPGGQNAPKPAAEPAPIQ
jgi:hypothetical protein